MRRRLIFWGTGVVIAILGVMGLALNHQWRQGSTVAGSNGTHKTVQPAQPTGNQTPDQKTPVTTTPVVTSSKDWVSPLGNPKLRVTKKTFGTYVTPQHSPVQPERFTGYHTGWDFETTPAEANADVPVTAFCAGKLLLKEWASGYGGVVIQSCKLNGQDVTVLYGHLNIDTVTVATNTSLTIGDEIGLLGAANSHQTDGERKHLHLSIHKGTAIDIKGYVQNKNDLKNWVNPTTYLGSI